MEDAAVTQAKRAHGAARKLKAQELSRANKEYWIKKEAERVERHNVEITRILATMPMLAKTPEQYAANRAKKQIPELERLMSLESPKEGRYI